MTGSLRYLLAAAFVAVFWLVPEPDHGYIAYLQTKTWLTGDSTPLSSLSEEGGGAPALQVDLRETGVSREDSSKRAADYARLNREWVRSKGRTIDPNLPPLLLTVHVGDKGFRSALSKRGEDMQMQPAGQLEVLREAKDDVPGYYPNRNSLIPAFLAIILAILTGKVIPSLLLGCLAGAMTYAGVFGGPEHFVIETVFQKVLRDDFNLKIIGFVLCLFMCMGVMTRGGGIQGMVELIQRYARGPVSSQICAFLIGLLIFFDDYSNCIITGSTMRPLTDRNRVSREKLAYIVDSTAAPIAGISIFSTWVAYEVSMFAPQLPEVTQIDGTLFTEAQGFAVFMQTLPFRYYCIFTLAMVLLTIILRREFGPMLKSERRAQHEGKPVADDAQPMLSKGMTELEPPADALLLARNALLPILTLVMVTLGLIFWTGRSAWNPDASSYVIAFTDLIGAADSTFALLIASASAFALATFLVIPRVKLRPHTAISLAGVPVIALIAMFANSPIAWNPGEDGFFGSFSAIISAADQSESWIIGLIGAAVLASLLFLGRGILTLSDALTSALKSAKALVFAVIILILAWSIGKTCGDLGTAQYLTAAFQQSFSPLALPIVMFLLSSLVAFSTGTSYGTMAILLPNVVVLAHTMGSEVPELGSVALMVITIGAVLEGSIFGDHCSPISDTTVLSSVATASDHLHHVRTQAPYAVFVMVVAILCGYVPATVIGPQYWPIYLLLGLGVIIATLLIFGRSPARALPGTTTTEA